MASLELEFIPVADGWLIEGLAEGVWHVPRHFGGETDDWISDGRFWPWVIRYVGESAVRDEYVYAVSLGPTGWGESIE